MCTLAPGNDYGQGKKAFNPSKRDPAYQMVSRARGDAAFARGFANDILLGKNLSYLIDYGPAAEQMRIDNNAGESRGDPTTWDKATGYAIQSLGTRTKIPLNKYASWVPQAFTGAMKGDDGNWYDAQSVQRIGRDSKGRSTGFQWSYAPGKKITDQALINQLNGGHYAFSAKGDDGKEVYMAWAGGFVPRKTGSATKAGEAEAGNVKKTSAPQASRTVVGVNTARPGNVIGGRGSLLGDEGEILTGQTLLSGARK